MQSLADQVYTHLLEDLQAGRNGTEQKPLFPLRNPGLLSNSKKPDLRQAGDR